MSDTPYPRSSFPPDAIPLLIELGFGESFFQYSHREVCKDDNSLRVKVPKGHDQRRRFIVKFPNRTGRKELKPRCFDTTKPKWKKSFWSWYTAANFIRMDERFKEEQETHAKETARQTAVQYIESKVNGRVTVNQLKRAFDLHHETSTGKFTAVKTKGYMSLRFDAFDHLSPDEQLEKATRVVQMLVQEGLIHP